VSLGIRDIDPGSPVYSTVELGGYLDAEKLGREFMADADGAATGYDVIAVNKWGEDYRGVELMACIGMEEIFGISQSEIANALTDLRMRYATTDYDDDLVSCTVINEVPEEAIRSYFPGTDDEFIYGIMSMMIDNAPGRIPDLLTPLKTQFLISSQI
jgi:hypothetical protein